MRQPLSTASQPTRATGPWGQSSLLAPGQALSIRPRHASTLQVAAGQVWVTFDGPHHGHANNLGDHVLQAGQMLAVPAGQRVVVERISPGSTAPAVFGWVDGTAAAPSEAQARAQPLASVLMPALRDLGQAAALAVHALGRLLVGLRDYSRVAFVSRQRC